MFAHVFSYLTQFKEVLFVFVFLQWLRLIITYASEISEILTMINHHSLIQFKGSSCIFVLFFYLVYHC